MEIVQNSKSKPKKFSFLCTFKVSVNNVYITNQFQNTIAQGGGGGGKSVSWGDCEYQGGKLLRLLSQLRPRIPPLDMGRKT